MNTSGPKAYRAGAAGEETKAAGHGNTSLQPASHAHQNDDAKGRRSPFLNSISIVAILAVDASSSLQHTTAYTYFCDGAGFLLARDKWPTLRIEVIRQVNIPKCK